MIPSRGLIPLAAAVAPRECGTKALNLSRLARLGYRVPPGMVVTSGVFQRHLRSAGVTDACAELLARLAALAPDEIRRRSDAIRVAILGTPIARSFQGELERAHAAAWRGRRIAVRSSSVNEDTGGASYAGQLDTVLGVDSLAGLEDAIRTVWASLWSERVLVYGARHGPVEMRMGVILQEQVDARHAGVFFTHDPVAARGSELAVVEYAAGLGDRLVAGEVAPNRARVRRRDLAIIAEDGSGSAAGPVLPDDTLRTLARIGLEIERSFGAPQDIEWCVDGAGTLSLLQARPITATSPGVRRAVWSNANIAENFPDVISPFLYSIVARGYTAYFRNLGLAFGISRLRLRAMSAALEHIVGLHAGRLYYNLSNIHAALYLAPGGAWLARWFNQFTGAREFPAVAGTAGGPLARAVEFARVALCTTWQYLWIRQRIARFERAVDRYAVATHPARLAGRDLPALAADLRGFLDIRLHRWNDAALADTAAMVCYGLLRSALPGAAGGASDDTAHGGLLSGLPGLVSARPIAELWNLSREVRRDGQLAALFAGATAAEIAARLEAAGIRAAPELDPFRGRLERYLDVWGFRYSLELMLTSPTPQEDPLPVIRLLQAYAAQDGPGPREISAARESERQRATEATAAALTPARWLRLLPFSRAARFRRLLRATQGAILLRERARMKQALLYTRLRHVALRMGEALARQGSIASRDDVFFLTTDEVLVLAGEDGHAPWARDAVSSRKEEQRRCTGLQPPDSFVLEWGEEWRPAAAASAAETRGEPGAALRGSGACGGVAEGHASVVLDVREADRVRAGDILVTRQTDPGWATVFFLVKGLVIERGGMLSHGAIIAREYGIPAVVGVPDATQLVRSGDRLRVDGDNGVVELSRA